MKPSETGRGATSSLKEYPSLIDFLREREIIEAIKVRLAISDKRLVLSNNGRSQIANGLAEDEWLLGRTGIASNVWFGDYPNPIWDRYKPAQKRPYSERTQAALLYEVLEGAKQAGWLENFDFGPVLEEKDGDLKPARGLLLDPEIAIFIKSREENHESIRQRVTQELSHRLQHPPKE